MMRRPAIPSNTKPNRTNDVRAFDNVINKSLTSNIYQIIIDPGSVCEPTISSMLYLRKQRREKKKTESATVVKLVEKLSADIDSPSNWGIVLFQLANRIWTPSLSIKTKDVWEIWIGVSSENCASHILKR